MRGAGDLAVGHLGIAGAQLGAEAIAAKAGRNKRGRAGAEKRVEHSRRDRIAGITAAGRLPASRDNLVGEKPGRRSSSLLRNFVIPGQFD